MSIWAFRPKSKRFDSNIDIADAWKRLENGTHTADDIKLLKA